VFYRLIRGLFRLVAALMFRFRVEGVERIPDNGPAVVVAPHRSWLDPPCVGGACPRPLHFLILRSVYDRRWARWFYRLMRTIPVDRGGSGSPAGLRGALRRLRDGQVVGLFPEGRVVASGSGSPIHPGAALLSVRTQAPVIPVEIHGSANAWPHGRWWPGPARIRVKIREPLLPPSAADRAAVEEMQRRIEALMRELDAASAGRGGLAGAQRRADRGWQ
jgi:1-acyl-sn-glycerol-3-phosphate acyltransferase